MGTTKIDQCFECKKIYIHPHGQCPIYMQIQKGMDLIDKAMCEADKKDNIISVVISGHWLAECQFECQYFEKK